MHNCKAQGCPLLVQLKLLSTLHADIPLVSCSLKQELKFSSESIQPWQMSLLDLNLCGLVLLVYSSRTVRQDRNRSNTAYNGSGLDFACDLLQKHRSIPQGVREQECVTDSLQQDASKFIFPAPACSSGLDIVSAAPEAQAWRN